MLLYQYVSRSEISSIKGAESSKVFQLEFTVIFRTFHTRNVVLITRLLKYVEIIPYLDFVRTRQLAGI